MVKQVFFTGVVVVNAGLLDTAAFGDVADAGGEVPFAEKKIDGYGFDGCFHTGHKREASWEIERWTAPACTSYAWESILPTGR